MIEVGTIWAHIDPSGCTTIWRVLDSADDPFIRHGSDVLLLLLSISKPRQSSMHVGSTTEYWSTTMTEAGSNWQQIEEEDIPLIILAGT